MKNQVYLIFCLVLQALFFSCKTEIPPASEYVPYISAYTGGLIYPSSAIQIELANEQDVAPGTEVKENLFSFSPAIKGKTSWINNHTLEFTPEAKALKSGQTYKAAFKLGNVVSVDKRLKTFHFSFKVAEGDFDIQDEVLDIIDPKLATATGTIRFVNTVELEQVKKAFSAQTSDKQPLSPEITATKDPLIFRYSIADIKRGKNDIDLELTVNGNVFNIDKKFSRTVHIPAADIFKVLSTELISDPENGVLITFSSPVSATQNLKGIITIPELGNNFTRQVKNNRVTLFFDRRGLDKITVKIDKGLKNSLDETLNENYSISLSLEKLKPEVNLLIQGNILPDPEKLILPFRAVALSAVDVKIIRIYESNILMFLQTNTLSGSNELRRAGRLIYKKTIQLDNPASKKLLDWQYYSVDLSKIIRQEQGAIYRIELSFKKEYSTYPCENSGNNNNPDNMSNDLTQLSDNTNEESESYWDTPQSAYYDSEYDWDDYNYSQRDNPCDPTYYMISQRKAVCNVLMSNIGVIAKSNSENQWWITVSNLLDTKAIANADVTLYNYQLQPVGNAKTDADGFAVINPSGKPFVLVAAANGQKSYLRLADGEDNMLSRFDIGGKTVTKGLKGFIYGERGVWRPGDTLHIAFILHDPDKRIPDNHPVIMELYNARGQFAYKQTLSKSVNGFYVYTVPTGENDPTGSWNVYIKVGGTSFNKSLRVEAIKPNRLKINLSIPGNRIDASADKVPATLTSSWLTGAIAGNLKAKVEMKLSRTQTQFKGYENYIFRNPASDFSTTETNVFDGALNETGEVKFDFKVPKIENAPGMLNADIVCRVFEQGGDASIYTQTLPYSPFSSYIGLNLNQKESSYYIETDENHRFDVVTLNSYGKPVDCDDLEYKIYKLNWSWWWESNSNLASYINNVSYQPVAHGKLKTANGKTSFDFMLKYPGWGRYFIYVKNNNSGHATGATVYIDWPEWRGRSNKSDPDNIKMLTFSTNKTSYEAGEDITVIIPASGGGTALVALENGSAVLSRTRVALSEKGDTKYTFKATEAMAPNFYIHISLLQPYAQTVNNLPMRMYGIVPILISNKESVLNPQINMPDVLRPEKEFTVEIREKNGKPMTYTLAIVDDGLLDLTNFKTPNPWDEFYTREALGIRTWDMYDFVTGAFGGKFAGMFSIGGDENLKPANTKANRFKPVVKYLGPFTLNKGETKKHAITLPAYVGSVRTMVVAGQDGAFGKAEKTTPVRSPLMILSSLPRVISANEEINLPVNVFAMENNVKDVSVKVETTGLLQPSGKNSQSVHFANPGDEIVYFPMKTGAKTGIEKVTITATGGGETSKETIEIDVRNPNPAIIISDQKLVEAGKTEEFRCQLTGTAEDDWIRLEVNRIPSIDFTRRFDFLYNYGHYCSEQLTSKALPLLFISQLKDVNAQEADLIKKNIRSAIVNLYGRQALSGGFVYWPGESYPNEWISSYAGNFLVMAKEKGYEVNEGVLNKWKSFQKKTVQNWAPGTKRDESDYTYYSNQYQQAYRLYGLALAGAPETGAMNRLKEIKDLSVQSRWCLAAAYVLDGKTKAAEDLVFNIATNIPAYYSRYTYGTSERDESMILQTMVLMGRLDQAFRQAQQIAKKLSLQSRFDTQSTAFALMAMGSLAEKMSGTIEFDWKLNGKNQPEVKSAKAGYQVQLPKQTGEGKVSLTNNGKGVLYVNLASRFRPLIDTLPTISNNLRLNIAYTDLAGKDINVSELKQGTDFIAQIEVVNTNQLNDYTDIALTYIIPSGWEIFNERMRGNEKDNKYGYTYRDIRDDRVLTYFDLSRGSRTVIKVRLQASYIGSFVLPAVQCEAMYDTSAQAKTVAGKVKVVK